MKNNRKIKNVIQEIAEKIKREYKPERVILFGSYAWGKPDKDSDIDLFIIKKTKERHVDRSVRVREILDEENGMFALDPIVYTPAETKERIKMGDDFIKKIITKGVAL
ncbi:MAG TPA: nucleotidyltransferase domain-containing protein [Candidatus Brocadiia bacterium]|nr:nucleotidyltransferase domain-containing protein [Planctomycetota bacterium]MBI4007588.1 nucleotidyltransferase domain-containing protein [Planctomycetota bacterium]MDO8093937.1 nucleotidyltransferase domain-containing protein [Candidatus Brocadiales bacterium]